MRKRARGIAGLSKWSLLALFALLACALVLSACGGGSSSSSSESSTTTEAESEPPASESEGEGEMEGEEGEEASANAPAEAEAKGEPIVTMTYTDVNTEGPQYKNIEETARVYQEWINAHGGIDGRPLEAKFCDAKGTSTGVAACGREAVADHVVATVGSYTITGDAIIPILEQGKTAQFGNCCAIAPSELTSEISFPMGSQPLYAAGLVKRAVEDGCEHINGVIIEGAEAFEPLMENAAKAEGTKIQKFVALPPTAQDYSAQVAEALSGGADCLVMIVSETPYIAWMPAFAQSGTEARMYGPQGNFNENAVKGFESTVEGDIVAGMYPDISLPQWASFREALETYEADESQDYNSLGGLGTWAAYEGFKQVVETMKGEINNETFLETVKTAKVNLPGLVPPINFANPWGKDGGPPEFSREMNRCAVFSEFKEGKLVPASTSFEDVSELAGGTKPMDCGPPFAKEAGE
jgi:ABC-type branched-subunit amino acid transport system substrate-binding protein